MRLIPILALLTCVTSAQSFGPPTNVLFSNNNNLSPTNQVIAITADGSGVAVTGSLTTIADVVVTNMSTSGSPVTTTNVLFPNSNDVSATNRVLVASRQGHFFCCYGSNGSVGDLVFIARNAGGTWVATNVLFPSSNDVPAVTTKPVISDDEQFIVCRGLAAVAEIVVIPINVAAGVYTPGTAFNEVVPGGNGIPLSAVDPVIAPNSLSFAIMGSNSAIGDVIVGTVGRPVTSGNTTLQNILFPGGNNPVSTLVPPAVSPMSNYYAIHGLAAVSDMVIVTVNATGTPAGNFGVNWPLANNTASTGVPPTVSGDGRLLAVNGTDTVNGDVVLVPMDPPTGQPGFPVNAAFFLNNNVANTAIPPVISSDSLLVLQRGAATIGDLVALQVMFTSTTTIQGNIQNILYPNNNNFPDINAHIALAPDRSYAVTLGSGTLGDIVITPFDAAGVGQTPLNVLYPSSNNVANVGTTPRISREGLLILTSGSSTIGDMVVTGVGLNASTGFIQNLFTTNVLYFASNDNSPPTREPVFSPTSQFAVSAGSSTIGDLAFVSLLDPFPRFLNRGDVGTVVRVRLFSPPDAGKTVLAAAAFGRYPGITLPPPDNRVVPLNPDLLFFLSLDPLNPVFAGFSGVLDANGVYDGETIAIPPVVALEGLFFYVAFVVFDPAGPIGIGTLSRPSVFLVE
jgi:hypothetical protein